MLSPYLLAILAAWVAAQGTKFILQALQTHSFSDFRSLYRSGSMPSSHSASAVALVTVIGLIDGVGSAIFGLAVLFAGIVMYDAVMVRRSSGEQGVAIKKLIKEQRSNIAVPRAAKGHTPTEVIVGALVGLIIGVIVFLLK